jgi:hypothetical protein
MLRPQCGFPTVELPCANFVQLLSASPFDVTIAGLVARQVEILMICNAILIFNHSFVSRLFAEVVLLEKQVWSI